MRPAVQSQFITAVGAFVRRPLEGILGTMVQMVGLVSTKLIWVMFPLSCTDLMYLGYMNTRFLWCLWCFGLSLLGGETWWPSMAMDHLAYKEHLRDKSKGKKACLVKIAA